MFMFLNVRFCLAIKVKKNFLQWLQGGQRKYFEKDDEKRFW